MTKAKANPTTPGHDWEPATSSASRRGILAGLLLAATAPATARAAPPPGPDAALLVLARRFDVVMAEYAARCEAEEAAEEAGDWSRDPALRAVVEQMHALRKAIGQSRATTPAGMAAKLRAAMLDWGDAAPDPFCQNHIGWSLCRDMLAAPIAGGGVA